MKIKILALLMFSLISINSFGQKKKKYPSGLSYRDPTEAEDSIAVENYKCIFQNKYSNEKRHSFYPFNKASKIVIISYNDSTQIENRTPVKNHVLNSSTVKETIELNNLQIDSLTSILYNITSKPNDFWLQIMNASGKCYNPRNSILFYNKKGEVMNYIEICFHCQNERFSSKKIKKFEYCETKYDLLKAYFVSLGIQYGTIYPE